MSTKFYKYQGTGNDFIMIDNRMLSFDNNQERISLLCHRRFGIGADGLILLENHESYDFRMVYYNSDGKEGSMCGNGARCITAFAKYLNLIDNTATFEAIDGMHEAKIQNDGIIALKMQDVKSIERLENHVFVDTGSPHVVQQISDLKKFNVKVEGQKIRYNKRYQEKGTNVNFVERISNDEFAVRTYERGVEDETLSCGTGVTAVALAMHSLGKTQAENIKIQTLGGDLKVEFKKSAAGYGNIWLIGPAQQVYSGNIS